MPIISRLYDLKSFGIFGVYLSAVGIIGSLATLRYEQALMLPKDVRDSANLLLLSLICVSLFGTLTALVCVPFGERIAIFVNLPKLAAWMWLLPFSIFFFGMYQTINAWATRRKQFHRASISQVVRSVAVAGTQTAAGGFGMGVMGLIGGNIAGNGCATAALAGQTLRDDFRLIAESRNFTRMKELAREYRDFPLYNNPQVLLNSVSQNLPIFFLGYYFGESVAGLYFMSIRVLQMPMNLVLTSLREVLFQKASEAYYSGADTYALFKSDSGTRRLGSRSRPGDFSFCSSSFSFVLGEKWYVSGEYARWLIVWVCIGFANLPAVIFGQVYRKQRMLLRQDILLMIFRTGSLVVGGIYLDALHTVILYSFVGLAFNLYIIYWALRFLKYQAIPPVVANQI